jgi:D-tyrosyl-tRNA(Tyr) deacylase
MRAVVQRVSRASVVVDQKVAGQIGPGLLVLVGVESGDGPADVEYLASKIGEARVFADDDGRMNRSVRDVGGAVLVVSQFTLLGDLRKGRRPAFDAAARPDAARSAYESLIDQLKKSGLPVEAGVFQADMRVELINEGPVTLLLDSRRLF